MNILIVYASKHGFTERAAFRIRDELGDHATIRNVKKIGNLDLETFDLILIGGSFHIGKIQSGIRRFIQKNLDLLLKKRVGIFLSCMAEGEEAETQLKNAFPEELLNSAVAVEMIGGEFNFEKMNFLSRSMIRKAAGTEKSVSNIKEQNIGKFISKIKQVIK